MKTMFNAIKSGLLVVVLSLINQSIFAQDAASTAPASAATAPAASASIWGKWKFSDHVYHFGDLAQCHICFR
jgi:hypothetical protein